MLYGERTFENYKKSRDGFEKDLKKCIGFVKDFADGNYHTALALSDDYIGENVYIAIPANYNEAVSEKRGYPVYFDMDIKHYLKTEDIEKEQKRLRKIIREYNPPYYYKSMLYELESGKYKRYHVES